MKKQIFRYGALASAICALVVSPMAVAAPVAGSDETTATVSSETDGSVSAVDPTACADFVQKAPIIAGDTQADGSPIVESTLADGHQQPVIVVHGWTASGTHNNARSGTFSHLIDRRANGHGGVLLADTDVNSSLVGAFQAIDGVVVYTFDYRPVSSRWVTDPAIGGRLADGIECVSDQYGVKPVVVGHSMGGLALRQALSLQDDAGEAISDRVTEVITFGTPEEGTELLATAGDVIDATASIPALGLASVLFKLIGQQCSQQADETGEYCLGVGGPVDAFYSQGAQAMYPGTDELEALPWWPEGMEVTALAGDIQLGGFSLFGKSARIADLGDLAVPADSAVAGSTSSETVQCEYGVLSSYSFTQARLKLTVGNDSSQERVTGLFTPVTDGTPFASPCYHGNLMSETTLTDIALDVVAERTENLQLWEPTDTGVAATDVPTETVTE